MITLPHFASWLDLDLPDKALTVQYSCSFDTETLNMVGVVRETLYSMPWCTECTSGEKYAFLLFSPLRTCGTSNSGRTHHWYACVHIYPVLLGLCEFDFLLCLQMFGCGAVAQLVLSGGSHGMFLTVNFAFGFAATLGILVCGQVSGKQSFVEGCPIRLFSDSLRFY